MESVLLSCSCSVLKDLAGHKQKGLHWKRRWNHHCTHLPNSRFPSWVHSDEIFKKKKKGKKRGPATRGSGKPPPLFYHKPRPNGQRVCSYSVCCYTTLSSNSQRWQLQEVFTFSLMGKAKGIGLKIVPVHSSEVLKKWTREVWMDEKLSGCLWATGIQTWESCPPTWRLQTLLHCYQFPRCPPQKAGG